MLPSLKTSPPWLMYWANLLRSAARNWLDTKAFIHAAALAFFTVFSIAPVLIVVVTITGMVLGESAAEGRLMEYVSALVGSEAGQLVENAVMNSQLDRGGLIPTMIGLVAITVGATTVFAQMQQSLNSIWDVVPKPNRSGILLYLKQRLLSLTVVLSIGFLLLVSLVLSVAVQAVLSYADQWITLSSKAVIWAELIGSIVVISLLFAAIFKVLPDVRLRWWDVIPAGFLTAVLFVLGRYLMARYLTNTAIASAYGAAGSLVLLLLWVHYSALILLFGAAFSRAQLEARGLDIRPTRGAAVVTRQYLP